MTNTPVELTAKQRLRLEAEVRIRSGTAPSTRGSSLGVDALLALYRLAGSPDSAGEGLKLLHELQTHQVEIDLQNDQLLVNERDFALRLEHYRTLYDFAPLGYFILGLDGQILEGNLAGAELFGLEADELGGSRIEGLLMPDSRPTLLGMLVHLRDRGTATSCVIQSDPVHGGRLLQLNASVAPSGQSLLMMVSELNRAPGA